MRTAQAIATHTILTGYGHWLPNDPRGSMSEAVHIPRISELGEVHHGRKRVQPGREELRAFHRQAGEKLTYPVLWFNSAARQALVDAFSRVIALTGLTCYACSVLQDHVHFLMRRHRVKAQEMQEELKRAGREALREGALVPPEHPVFSADSCTIYKNDPRAVRACIEYINANFAKHRLPLVRYPFVVEYDNWPLHKRK